MVKELINSIIFGFVIIFKILINIGIPMFAGIGIGRAIKSYKHKLYIETGYCSENPISFSFGKY